MSEPDLAAIIIVNWNGMQFVERCLTSVYAQKDVGTYQVLFVDNGSTDGSPEWVERHFPQTKLIRLPQNYGFAKANNIGIAASESRHVVLLNNDTQVERHWLMPLIDAVESDGAVGMCAPRIVLADQPDTIDSAGIRVDLFGFAWQRGHGHADRPAGAYRTSRDVFGPSAAAALYRRSMINAIGMFDEDFQSYYEDVDLAWRAQLAGWRCRYVPDALVTHIHSATGGRDPDRKQWLLTRNRWWTVIKNMPAPRLYVMLPVIAAADVISFVRGMLRHRNGVPIRARLDALKGMRHMWAKRRKAQT